ncbi:hypothetical protein [Telmatospirillum sp. J64-1]|uniref:hypothetical protein n=1 Tax=Telmatospirillum sp. J64-1 TaxID=2502183 RepID=UPI00115D15BB|nr:hypothetical protein [Telmatospirillum sp. J64-1]
MPDLEPAVAAASRAPAIQEPRPIRTTAVAAVAAVAATSPVAAAAQAPAPVTQHIQITVNPAPGMDEAALAREVRRQLELAQSHDRAAARNRLYDGTE